MQELIYITVTDEQIQRAGRGEAVEIIPAKENHQILIDQTEGLLTARYVPVEDTES